MPLYKLSWRDVETNERGCEDFIDEKDVFAARARVQMMLTLRGHKLIEFTDICFHGPLYLPGDTQVLQENKFAYLCYFDFDGQKKYVTSFEGKNLFRDGFWVDKEFRLSRAAEGMCYWIPPSRILYIERAGVHALEPAHDSAGA